MTSGICAVGLSLITSKRQNLIVSAIFSSAISCGNAALDCLITEIFPTNLRYYKIKKIFFKNCIRILNT